MLEYIVACVWSFAEATFFFFIPDIYLTRMALFSFRKAVYACVLSAVCACVGGVVMYYIAEAYPQGIMRFLVYVPAIFPKLINAVMHGVDQHPLQALMTAPLYGEPYKIYAAAFGVRHFSLASFIAVSFVARLLRFLLATVVCGVVVRLLSRFYSRDIIEYCHIYAWGVIYVLYFSLVVYRYF